MNFNFNLGVKARLPEDGFSLSELIIATKNMFETEGMVGFLKILLEILDQYAYLSMSGSCEHDCCDSPYFRVNQKEVKRVPTSVGLLNFSWTRLQCKSCRKTTIPLRSFLNMGAGERKTPELERIVTEVVSEQSYRRTSQHLQTIGCIPIPHQRIHRWVMKSDCDKIGAKSKFKPSLLTVRATKRNLLTVPTG